MATKNIDTHRYRYNERLYLELVMLLNLPIDKKPNRISIILNTPTIRTLLSSQFVFLWPLLGSDFFWWEWIEGCWKWDLGLSLTCGSRRSNNCFKALKHSFFTWNIPVKSDSVLLAVPCRPNQGLFYLRFCLFKRDYDIKRSKTGSLDPDIHWRWITV